MPSILLRNIKSLIQVRETNIPLKGAEMRDLKAIENAWLLIENQEVKDFGTMETCPENADQVIDVTGRMILPSWCDSHTHLVFAGSREGEFVDRINGLSYEEIAQRGGGILNSASRLRNTTEEELFEHASRRLEEVRGFGTGAIEIKSGYGLTTASELKMLRVIRRLKAHSDMTIKSTFLGALHLQFLGAYH
jgi:imidazolonepropionase